MRPAAGPSFLYREKYPRLFLVFRKSGLLRLLAVGHGDAHEYEKQRIGQRAREEPPALRHGADAGEPYPPPHAYLAEIVGMAGVFPRARADEAADSAFAEAVHEDVRIPLQYDGGEGDADEYDAPDRDGRGMRELIGLHAEPYEFDAAFRRRGRAADYGEDGGQDAAVDHEGRDHVYPDEVYQRIGLPRFFMQHDVPPVLMREAVEGVDPVGCQAHAPEAYGNEQQHAERREMTPDCEAGEDEYGLDAPIGIVYGGVFEYEAEYEGQTQKLSDYVGKGKYVLVDFWASWCGPCRGEIPTIIDLYNKYAGDNFAVLGVATWDEPADTRKAMEELGIQYPQIMNAQKAGSDAYNIEGIPEIILFAPDGTIVKRGLRGEAMVKAVEEALGK